MIDHKNNIYNNITALFLRETRMPHILHPKDILHYRKHLIRK